MRTKADKLKQTERRDVRKAKLKEKEQKQNEAPPRTPGPSRLEASASPAAEAASDEEDTAPGGLVHSQGSAGQPCARLPPATWADGAGLSSLWAQSVPSQTPLCFS